MWQAVSLPVTSVVMRN